MSGRKKRRITKEHRAAERSKFPHDRGQMKVSDLSAWTDFFWRFKPTSPGSIARLGWDFILPDGRQSTDPEHVVLLESFREVIWGMLTRMSWYGRRLKVGSANTFGVGMRDLFRWMVYRGLRSFEELTSEQQLAYLEDIPSILSNRSRFYGQGLGTEEYVEEDGALDVSDDALFLKPKEDLEDQLTYCRIALRVNTFYFIYAQSEALAERGLPLAADEPFGGRSANEVIRELADYIVNRIPPLPDEVALPLLQEAMAWVEEKAVDVLQLQTVFLERHGSAIAAGLSQQRAIFHATRAIQRHTFTTLRGHSEPWRGRLERCVVEHPEHGEATLNPVDVLRAMIFTLRAACILLIQYMAGLRAGEVCSLQGGWRTSDEFPNCITVRLSKSGIVELFFVSGIAAKGRDQPQAEEWLVGCRPAGSTHVPAAVRAVMVLDSLFKPWREAAQIDELVVQFSQPRSLPRSPEHVGRFTVNALDRDIKRFVFSEIDLSELPDTNSSGEDLATYRESRGLCIRSHQGRKTFAAYMLESRTSLLKAVSQQFKHMHSAMTEAAYFPAVSRLRKETETYRMAETIAFFVDAIEGMPVYGRMAELINQYFGTEEWQSAGSRAELESKVAELVRVHDLRIFFSDHGKCLIKANPLESRCRDAGDGASWAADTPNYAARSPSMCAGCGCFSVDRSHLPFWKRRHQELVTVMKSADPSRSHEFRVLALRATQAQKILRTLQASPSHSAET